MGSISLIDTLGKIEKSGLKFLDYSVLGRLTGNYNRNSLYKMASRLEKKKISDEKLKRDLNKFLPLSERPIIKELKGLILEKL